uniref:Uncharacterized protein n=1 Tax=Cacopsylla melanoneura TaxID=428564 RepID=A0A8D8SNV0_9HEMI
MTASKRNRESVSLGLGNFLYDRGFRIWGYMCRPNVTKHLLLLNLRSKESLFVAFRISSSSKLTSETFPSTRINLFFLVMFSEVICLRGVDVFTSLKLISVYSSLLLLLLTVTSSSVMFSILIFFILFSGSFSEVICLRGVVVFTSLKLTSVSSSLLLYISVVL